MWKLEGPTVLWVSVSPSLKFFDLPLLQKLMKARSIARWEYAHSLDEASSLDGAVTMLIEYLLAADRPVHLAGHELSGVVAMLAAAQCPEQVRSIALPSTSILPGLTWQAHYYLQRLSTPCSQARILANCARSLWGPMTPYSVKSLVSLLEKDLLLSPSPHSLFQVAKLAPIELSMPKWVCGGANDFVISPAVFQRWREQMGPGDRLCQVPDGTHFFHTVYSDWVATELIHFWQCQEQGIVSFDLYSDSILESQVLN